MVLEKTQLKLQESSKGGELIGFISRAPRLGKLFGVRENSRLRKKICVVSEHLRGHLKPNVLYEVSVKPMHNGTGYVIVKAELIQFEALLQMSYTPQKRYRIIITFGNKRVYFDPIDGKTSSSRTVEGVCAVLSERSEISNKEKILSDFMVEAIRLLDRMAMDGVKYHK